MSKFYKVKIEEKFSRNVIVKADSSDEADEIISDLCNDGIIDLNGCDFDSREWFISDAEKALDGSEPELKSKELYNCSGYLNPDDYIFTNGIRVNALQKHLCQKYVCSVCSPFADMIFKVISKIASDDFTHTKDERFFALCELLPNVSYEEILPFMAENEVTESVLKQYGGQFNE